MIRRALCFALLTLGGAGIHEPTDAGPDSGALGVDADVADGGVGHDAGSPRDGGGLDARPPATDAGPVITRCSPTEGTPVGGGCFCQGPIAIFGDVLYRQSFDLEVWDIAAPLTPIALDPITVGGASMGDDPQQFFLGGMQNWLNRDLSNDFRIENLDDLYFASFATPLRGADFYAQVGRRVALANIEFRFPMLRHLALGFPLPIELGNIRGALFADVGSAWNNNSDWRLTSRTERGERRLHDLLLGYGLGARWNLGFFVLKLDVGWQDDLSRRTKPHWYLTLGPEF